MFLAVSDLSYTQIRSLDNWIVMVSFHLPQQPCLRKNLNHFYIQYSQIWKIKKEKQQF